MTSWRSAWHPRTFGQLLWHAVIDSITVGVPSSGAAIAYYALFALAPLLLMVIAIAGLLWGQEAVRGEIVQQISGLIGLDGAAAIQAILQRVRQPREGAAATLLGLLVLAFAATGAFLELQSALNRIWHVKAAPGIDMKGLVRHRLRALAMVVSLSFLLLVSLTVSAAVNAAMLWFGHFAIGWPMIIMLVNQGLSLFVSGVLFGLLYLVLPDVQLDWRDVAVGAFLTAVLFVIGQRLIGLYLGNSMLASPFGAAGTVAIILVWVYYSTQIVLYGAVFTRVWAEHRRGPPPIAGAVVEIAPESGPVNLPTSETKIHTTSNR